MAHFPNVDSVTFPSRPSRRGLLGGVAAACALGGRPAPACAGSPSAHSWGADGLASAAAAKGVAFGSAVGITSLRMDPAYAAAVARECSILTCENAMKMLYALPDRDRADMTGADETVRFAEANGQRMRGHCLIWHEGLPVWTGAELTNARDAEVLMRRWITGIAGRYRGRIEVWDVVNEVAANEDLPHGLRPSPWLDALGPRYVELAFAMLRDADPRVAAAYNENDLEMGSDWVAAKRTRVLGSLERWLGRGVPIRRLGLQAHLDSTAPFDGKSLRAFLAEVAGLGLAIEVTEFDVDDRAFPADLDARRRGVSDLARRFLDVALDEPALLSFVTWDISNADTWLNHDAKRRRPDGLPHQALPLEADYRRNALWQAMRRAFATAPDHRAARARLREG